MQLLPLLSLALLGACAPNTEDTAPLDAMAIRIRKVEVCHFNGEEEGNVISISPYALGAHLGHGDHIARDEEVCDDGVDNDCDGVVDEDCVVACPCFDAADLDAAYADWLASGSTIGNAACYDESFSFNEGPGDFGQIDQVSLSFETLTFTLSGLVITNDAFGASSEDTTIDFVRTESRTCEATAAQIIVGSVEGSGEVVYDEQIEQDVNEQTLQACQDLILDWASDNALVCEIANDTEEEDDSAEDDGTEEEDIGSGLED